MKKVLLSAIALFCIGAAIAHFAQNQPGPTKKPMAAPTPGGATSSNKPVTSVTWEPLIEMDEMLFPSYVYAIATRKSNYKATDDYKGDPEGQIGIGITCPSANTKIKVVIEAPEIMYTTTYEETLANANKKYEIFPVIKYKFDELLKIKQPKIVSINFKVFVNDKEIGEKTKITNIRSINDCLIGFTYRDNKTVKMQEWMVSAYVNENSPLIQDQILPAVMKTKVIDNITGYLTYSDKNTDECTKNVLLQVLAVWTALQERNVVYSSITGNSSSNKLAYQYIRYLDDSWRSNQANCVDGSALFASILYKMGIQPIMIIVPGHCFLGFYDRPIQNENGKFIDDRPMYFLETTLIGNKTVDETKLSQVVVDYFDQIVKPEVKQNNSFAVKSFINALLVGTGEYRQYKPYFGDPSKRCVLCDVDQCRREGVSAIPYKD